MTTGALLARETLRTSRRWHHYALRMVFLGALTLAILLVWQQVMIPGAPPSAAGRLGRRLFEAYVPLQLGILAIGAPLLVAQGIQEERDEGTLDLLRLTRLGPHHLLLGKVGSRLGTLLVVVYGGAPLLGLVVGLGGVSRWEVGNALASTLATAVVLGLVAAHAAWLTRGLLVPVMLSAVWAFGAFVSIPLVGRWFSPRMGGSLLGHYVVPLTPLDAAGADGPIGLAAIVALGAASVLSLGLTLAAIGERTRLLVGIALLTGLAATSFLAAPMTLELGHLAAAELIWAWSLLALLVYTATLQLSLQFVASQLALHARPHREWGRWWGEVHGNPLAWREGTTWIRSPVAVGSWLVVLVPGLLLASPHATPPAGVLQSAAGLLALAALVHTVLPITRTLAVERVAGTLPLLLATTLRSRSILLGKLGPVALRAVPLVVLSVALWMRVATARRAQVLRSLGGVELLDASPFGANLWPTSPALETAWSVGWAAGAWVLLAALVTLVSLRVRPVRAAWPANLLLVALLVSVPALPLGDAGPVVGVQRLLFPLAGPAWMVLPGTPPELVLATGTVWTLGLAAWVWTAHRLRAWGAS